jgi:hypothetical protein
MRGIDRTFSMRKQNKDFHIAATCQRQPQPIANALLQEIRLADNNRL